METKHLILFILIKSTVILAESEDNHIDPNDNSVEHNMIKDSKEFKNDWEDLFVDPESNLFPTPSTTLMAQATQSDKSPEEQLEEMKAMADHITMLVKSEMANLVKLAMSCGKKDDQSSRKKRSIETPMDSTKLIMRLLQHIKSNNEYQNIAIDKMMTAQEIADKYGIAFDPDTEVLSELAKNANKQAIEMTSILKDACDLKNSSLCNTTINATKGYTEEKFKNVTQSINQNDDNDYDSGEYEFVPLSYDSRTASRYNDKPSPYNYYNIHPQETQVPQPPLQNCYTHTTPRPNLYDTMLYSAPDYLYCSVEPTMFDEYLPIGLISEPLVVAEEYEETISSKVLIEADQEPGSGTVSHVTTYTLSEKTHFKNPEIENLPQQMQYYFFLV